ncbi:uncharacterized protein LOC113237731 [Hyposmocoma kahamanoa]|uniref:uncharacterized protein LOC113237731 n=1 Tax=Hyposmocoma kahamanoa TaxID=1477025 RepID=UPI000E6D8305|nr:uncharacterized protein LOC113237731 [Hyposmocoma kahamanoa]
MKSWSLLVFAGLLSVGKANVELYSFFKETDSKHSVQKSDVHSPSVAASLLQVPVGFQLHLVPSSLKSSLGSPNTISLPQQSFIPSLRVSDVEAAPNKTATTRTDETTKQPSSDVTTSEAPATADLAVRSVVRVGPDLLVAQVVPSNDTEIQHTGHVLLPATRSQILLQVAKSPQPPNNFQDPLNVQQSHNLHQSHNLQQSFSLQQPHNLQQPHKLQHLQTTSQLRCDFPEYRAMVCVGDLETTCDRPYRVDPKCPFKQERCLCSEGYVRPFDYHQVHHMSGTCNPESSCQKKGNYLL